jgi:hypothetical protein
MKHNKLAFKTADQSNPERPANLHAETIAGVIASLDKIVDWSKINSKRAGYFAALYRKVTIKVKEGIESGYFENAARMEKLDVIFANRYLDAFENYYNGLPVTKVWQLAFKLLDEWHHIVLHHLMIGMNAHINLDLGIAAAQSVPANEMPGLKADFDKINDVLSDLVDVVENELAIIWPVFKWLDNIAGNIDERMADCGMEFARDRAWDFAMSYAQASDKEAEIQKMDSKMYLIGQLFIRPGLIKRANLLLIRIGERGSVKTKIEVLE